MKHLLLLSISVLLLLGCGTTRKEWVEQNCNEASGFASGQKDAKSGQTFDIDFIEKCPSEQKELARKGYLDGYKASGGVVEQGPKQYNYGKDIFQDVIHAINKEPSKKNPEPKSETLPPKK